MANSAKSGGVGCLTVVGIVFLVLKLLEIEPVAHWSWWWVTCPFWAPIAIALVLAFVFVLLTEL